jgi:hypothetical protein
MKADHTCCDTIEDLHACGNTACFSGYMAISGLPGLSRDDYSASMIYEGTPNQDCADAEEHMAAYLDVSLETARQLIYGRIETCEDLDFYPVPFSMVKPQHVIDKLVAVLCGELK